MDADPGRRSTLPKLTASRVSGGQRRPEERLPSLDQTQSEHRHGAAPPPKKKKRPAENGEGGGEGRGAVRRAQTRPQRAMGMPMWVAAQ